MYTVTSTASYFVSKKLANRAPVTRRGKKVLLIDPSSYLNGKEIQINVSGSKYRLHESYIKQHPETLLAKKRDRKMFYDAEENEYFFDRDPHIFRYIHKYYKTGKLHFSEIDCFEAFMDEMDFFGINVEEISACCSYSYGSYLCDKAGKNKEKPEEKIIPENFRQLCWQFTEEASSCLAAKVFVYLSCFMIIVSIILSSAETVYCKNERVGNITISRRCGEVYKNIFFSMDTTCIAFFTLEYLLRFYGAPNRFKFFKSKMSLVDVMAIVPYFIDMLLKALNLDHYRMIQNLLVASRSFRVVRVFKLTRHSKRFKSLCCAIGQSSSELSFIVFMYSIVVITFASIIYYAENFNGRKSKFVSIPEAIWYTVVTTTTLGYGDVVPETVQGKLIGSLCCLMGVLVIALPVPIIQMKSNTVSAKDVTS